MQGFTLLDTFIFLGYLVLVVGIGSLFVRSQHNVGDFFLAGRTMGWFPIALSIIATNLSAITYIGAPAMVLQHDLKYTLAVFLHPPAIFLVAYLVAGLFYRLQIFTVYEYLERRFNLPLRFLASFLFLLTKLGWLATALYTPSLALSVVTGIDLYSCIVTVGILATFYAAMGGMKAVIWTDVLQFFVLVGGSTLALFMIYRAFDGDIMEIWRIATEEGRTEMVDFSLDLHTPFTFWSLLFGLTVVLFYDFGLNQVVVQRYFAAKSLQESMRGIIANAILIVPVVLSLYLLGVGLVSYYHVHPEMMEGLIGLEPANPGKALDKAFPYFVVHALPAGISGLIISGIFAATMSSVDSGVNSLTTVTIVDFYKRFLHSPEKDDRHYLKAARWGTLVWGGVATFTGLFVGQLGTIVEIMGRIYGFLTGPLVAIFLLGILSKRTNSAGVFIGALMGLGCVAWAAKFTEIHWLWHAPIGLLCSAVPGYLLSLLGSPPSPEQLNVQPAQISAIPESGPAQGHLA